VGERQDVPVRKAFLRTCWLPAALWIATLLYLRPYDGWGAWAAAPLLLPSLGMSCFWGAWGAGLLVLHASRLRALDWPVMFGMLIGAGEFLFYWIRYLTRPY
jgi:hypothetical protein